MRSIQYSMKLKGSYNITNRPIRSDGRRMTEAEKIKLPGIKMTVEECENLDELYQAFEYVQIDNAQPKFMYQIPEILRGKQPDWKLSLILIYPDRITLAYDNEALFSKYHERVSNYRGYVRDFYSELITIDPKKLTFNTKLRFEVHNPNGSTSVFYVLFGGYTYTRVTEFEGNRGREFYFNDRRSGEREYSVEVEEWIQ